MSAEAEEQFLTKVMQELAADPAGERARLEKRLRKGTRALDLVRRAGAKARAAELETALGYVRVGLLLLDGLRAGSVHQVRDGAGALAWTIDDPSIVARYFPNFEFPRGET